MIFRTSNIRIITTIALSLFALTGAGIIDDLGGFLFNPVPMPGPCPNMILDPPVIDPQRLSGQWFSTNTSAVLFEDCSSKYTPIRKGKVITLDVYDTLIIAPGIFLNGFDFVYDGRGTLGVNYTYINRSIFPLSYIVSVIATDYQNYLALYKCVPRSGNQHSAYILIESRKSTLSAAGQKAVAAAIAKNNLTGFTLHVTNRQRCDSSNGLLQTAFGTIYKLVVGVLFG